MFYVFCYIEVLKNFVELCEVVLSVGEFEVGFGVVFVGGDGLFGVVLCFGE